MTPPITEAEAIAKLREADARIAAMRKREEPATGPDPLKALLESIAKQPQPTEAELAERERVYQEERRVREEREAAARAKADRSQRMWRIADMPIDRAMVAKVVDGDIANTPAMDAVRKWVDARKANTGKPTLVLLGGAGTGKTLAAAWAIAHCRDGHYTRIRDIANLYRAGFGDDAKDFVRLLESDLLVIDELTTERDADLGRAALHEVIDERQHKDRPTILIANRTAAELRERYDARTIDRLREGAVVVALSGKSMRKGNAL